MDKTIERAYRYYQLAKEAIDRGEAETALFNVRKSLETAIKSLCERCNIDTYGDDLYGMIQKLFESDMFTKEENGILHRTRMKGNYGAHAQDSAEEADIDDAKEGLYYLEKSLVILKKCCESKDKIETANNESNKPMENPNYYQPTRRYYGMWCNCYSRSSLMSVPEYVELKKQADNGDIQAMLDIAVGFLNKQIQFGDHEVVCMSFDYYKYSRYKDYYNSSKNRLYDPRYYYWVIKAAELASENYFSGKSVPLKYIATALLEALKFSCLIINGTQSILSNAEDQFNMLKEMYGCKDPILSSTERVLLFLEQLVDKYGMGIISPLHKETESDIKTIKYIAIITQAARELRALGTGNLMSENINDSIVISDDDLKKPVFYSVDKYKDCNRINRNNYELMINSYNNHYLKNMNISSERLISSEVCINCEKSNNETYNFCVCCGHPLYNSKKETGDLYFLKEFEWLNIIIQSNMFEATQKLNSMCSLGYMYEHGIGVEQDFAKALEWYTKAANAGSVTAMNYLGSMYEHGNGVEADLTEAQKWYQKAIIF